MVYEVYSYRYDCLQMDRARPPGPTTSSVPGQRLCDIDYNAVID